MIEIKKWKQAEPAAQLAGQIYQLLTDVYGSSPWTLELIERDLASPSNVYLLAQNKEELLAFLSFQETDREAEIMQIAVRKDCRRQGLATALFDYLPDKDIFLEVRESNQSALLFYKKATFKEIARRRDYYREPCEDAIIMKRESNER